MKKINDIKHRLMRINLHISGLTEINFEIIAYEIHLSALHINIKSISKKEDYNILLNILACTSSKTTQINEDILKKLRDDLITLEKKYSPRQWNLTKF